MPGFLVIQTLLKGPVRVRLVVACPLSLTACLLVLESIPVDAVLVLASIAVIEMVSGLVRIVGCIDACFDSVLECLNSWRFGLGWLIVDQVVVIVATVFLSALDVNVREFPFFNRVGFRKFVLLLFFKLVKQGFEPIKREA